MKKFIKIFFFYLFIILLTVEIFLRLFLFCFTRYSQWEGKSGLFVYDSLLGWRGAPNRTVYVKTFESKFLVKNDSLGFRNNPYNGKKNGRKILMYGDSFLWGYHLNNEELISSRLSEELNVEVRNYGMVGYGTDQEYILFKGSVEDSSLVVFFFFNNDLQEILSDNKGTKSSKPKFVVEKDSLILLNSPVDRTIRKTGKIKNGDKFKDFGIMFKVTRFLKLSLYKTKIYTVLSSYLQYTKFGKFLYEKNLLEPDLLKPDEDPFNNIDWKGSLKIYEKLIVEVQKECKKRGCDLIVFMIPSEWTYQKELQKKMESLKLLYGYDGRYEEVMDSVEDVLRRNGIRYIYPLEDFRRADVNKKLTKKFDMHFSKDGAELVKDILKKEIEKF